MFQLDVSHTAAALTYYDEAGKEAKDTIPIARIIGVEPVSPSAFLKSNVFQVTYAIQPRCILTPKVIVPGSILYVYCEVADDYDQWILALR